MKVDAIVVDLGQGNNGKFGPNDHVKGIYDKFVTEVANDKYIRKPSGGSCCVDGRNRHDGLTGDGVHCAMQIPGSEVLTNTAGDMMDSTLESPVLSQRVIANTKEVVEDGRVPELHGDDHKHEDGCAANFQMRATLQYAFKNIDSVAEKVMTICGALGLDAKGITMEAVKKAIEIGGQRALSDAVWDIDCKKVVELAVENGAKYVELEGEHLEQAAVATLEPGETFDSQLFAQDHLHEGHREELFGISAGEYMVKTMESAAKRGKSEQESVLKVMRGIIYTVGLSKQIGSADLKIIALKHSV